MTEQMDPMRAARLLERWFSFYGRDDPEAWPPEDYPQIRRAYEAMQLAVEVLRGHTPKKKAEMQKAIAQLEEWLTLHSMEDPDDWGNRWTSRLCAMCWKPCALPLPF